MPGRLAQDDLEHGAVHRVVDAVEQRGAHRRARLTEAVHPAFALLVARRVPREVVVDDGVEVLLQVDALRQAVGGDEHPAALGRADPRHALLALVRGHLAGHRVDGDARQAPAEVAGHVVGRRDEAAEHHHVEPGLDQLRDVLRGGPELRIAAPARESLRRGDQPGQRRVVAAGRRLDVVRHERVRVAVEDAVQQIVARLVAEVLAGAGAQGQRGRRRTRPGAAQERQRSPEIEALPPLVPGARLHDLGAVVQHVVEKRLPGAAEPVGEFPRFAARKEVALAPLRDVGPPALDEVLRQALAESFALRARGLREALEVGIQQTEEPVEGCVVAAVRRGRQQDEVPRGVARQAPQQLVALVPAAAGRGARVRLVHDHEVGTRLEEVVAPLARLDVVEADDRVRVHREEARARRNAAFQAPRAAGGDRGGAEMEADLQFGDPLVHEMRRAEHDAAVDVAAVEQLAGDEQRLDRLADPHVVGDEQAHGVELQRHEQRHELVGARARPLSVRSSGRGRRPAAARAAARRAAAGPSRARRAAGRPAGGTGLRGSARSRAADGSASGPRPSP